jgi:tripartite-type tricarboxylate transporter receptor subunit TctC
MTHPKQPRHARRVLLTTAAALGLLTSFAAHAQQPVPGYPDKTIRMIVPFPAGGTTDIVARLVAKGVTSQWGQPVVVDNKGGAAGMTGSAEGARAAPDGYIVVMGNNQTHATNAALFAKPAFDIVGGVTPIAMLTRTKHVVVVRSESPIKTYQELVAAGKSRHLNFGSSSPGSSSEIISSGIRRLTGMDATNIPYKGAAPLMVDLLGGQVDFSTATYGSASVYIRDGKLRPLAITGEQRDPELPNVPTFAELGIDSLSLHSWVGLFAPAGLPEPIARAWSEAVAKILKEPDSVSALKAAGFEVWFKPYDEMKGFHPEEVKRWAAEVKAGGISLN